MLRTNNGSFLVFVSLVLTFCVGTAWAVAPVLYSNSAYESPVRGDPDDLLLISGSGLAANDTVVYRLLGNSSQAVVHPSVPPKSQGSVLGFADLVSAANAPYSLTGTCPLQ